MKNIKLLIINLYLELRKRNFYIFKLIIKISAKVSCLVMKGIMVDDRMIHLFLKFFFLIQLVERLFIFLFLLFYQLSDIEKKEKEEKEK
jgi:hypothetical protein